MSHLAIDLGATSGRAMLGTLRDGALEIREVHRFPNTPVRIGNRIHWDILRLLREISVKSACECWTARACQFIR